MSHSSHRPNWPAVFAIAFCVACLITAEFLPVSLLTPMAADLHISEGTAGQTVTVTALVAMFASVIITSLIKNSDRRYVVIAFAVLLSISSLIVALSTNFYLLLGGRVVLGIALGGILGTSGLGDDETCASSRVSQSAFSGLRWGIYCNGYCGPHWQLPRQSYRLAKCIYWCGNTGRDLQSVVSKSVTRNACYIS